MPKRAAIDRGLEIKIPMTSCWCAKLPKQGFARIGISRGPPRRQSGYRVYSPLAPGPWFRSVDVHEFARLYMSQLAKLDPREVLRELAALAGDDIPVLLCFETPGSGNCHRGWVSAWFADGLGIKVFEYGQEGAGWGWTHPMLP
jgi:hypothetical protein